MALVIIIGIAVVLFLLAFVTKRRFGVLGLGLAAGTLLSLLWAATLSTLLKSQDISVEPFSYATASLVAVTLLPSLMLMIAGPKYHDKRGAFVGALMYSSFAVLLIISPIVRDFAVAGDVSPVLTFLSTWQNLLIGLGVLLAVIDMMLAQGIKFPSRRKSGKH